MKIKILPINFHLTNLIFSFSTIGYIRYYTFIMHGNLFQYNYFTKIHDEFDIMNEIL